MKSILKFIVLLLLLTVSALTVVPLIILMVDAVEKAKTMKMEL